MGLIRRVSLESTVDIAALTVAFVAVVVVLCSAGFAVFALCILFVRVVPL